MPPVPGSHLLERATSSLDAIHPVLILTDHVALRVRLRAVIEPSAPVAFVRSESELLVRLLRPVRLLLIDGAPPFADPRLPARIRGAAQDPRVPIVVLATSRSPAWAGRQQLVASGQVDDVIHSDTERQDVLVAAWSLPGDRCRRRVEALRLAHESTPAALHHLFEELLINEGADLSVTAWAASKPDGSRFTLRRQLAKQGVSPAILVDVARVLNAVARAIVRGHVRPAGHLAVLPEERAARRLLSRAMGMTPTDLTELASKEGPDAVRVRARHAVGEMLRGADSEKLVGR